MQYEVKSSKYSSSSSNISKRTRDDQGKSLNLIFSLALISFPAVDRVRWAEWVRDPQIRLSHGFFIREAGSSSSRPASGRSQI